MMLQAISKENAAGPAEKENASPAALVSNEVSKEAPNKGVEKRKLCTIAGNAQGPQQGVTPSSEFNKRLKPVAAPPQPKPAAALTSEKAETTLACPTATTTPAAATTATTATTTTTHATITTAAAATTTTTTTAPKPVIATEPVIVAVATATATTSAAAATTHTIATTTTTTTAPKPVSATKPVIVTATTATTPVPAPVFPPLPEAVVEWAEDTVGELKTLKGLQRNGLLDYPHLKATLVYSTIMCPAPVLRDHLIRLRTSGVKSSGNTNLKRHMLLMKEILDNAAAILASVDGKFDLPSARFMKPPVKIVVIPEPESESEEEVELEESEDSGEEEMKEVTPVKKKTIKKKKTTKSKKLAKKKTTKKKKSKKVSTIKSKKTKSETDMLSTPPTAFAAAAPVAAPAKKKMVPFAFTKGVAQFFQITRKMDAQIAELISFKLEEGRQSISERFNATEIDEYLQLLADENRVMVSGSSVFLI